MDNRLEDAQKIVDEFNKDTDMKRVEEFVKDNKIQFDFEDKTYRVKLLSLKDKEEVNSLKIKKFYQLFSEGVKLTKNLIEMLKEQRIDIDKLDEDIRKLSTQKKEIELQIGEAIAKNEVEIILNSYGEKWAELENQQKILNTQRTLVLEYSLENQLENYVYQLVTYLSLEVKDGEEFKKAFVSLEDFQNNCKEILAIKAGQFSVILQTM
jgi:hypothetical protein